MSETAATLLLILLGGYFTLGLLFAIPFVCVGLAHIDAAAAAGSIGFRLLILPGVMLFWPLLAGRWLRGVRMPPDECSAHLRAARKDAS